MTMAASFTCTGGGADHFCGFTAMDRPKHEWNPQGKTAPAELLLYVGFSVHPPRLGRARTLGNHDSSNVVSAARRHFFHARRM
jgi:hypothetical protein